MGIFYKTDVRAKKHESRSRIHFDVNKIEDKGNRNDIINDNNNKNYKYIQKKLKNNKVSFINLPKGNITPYQIYEVLKELESNEIAGLYSVPACDLLHRIGNCTDYKHEKEEVEKIVEEEEVEGNKIIINISNNVMNKIINSFTTISMKVGSLIGEACHGFRHLNPKLSSTYSLVSTIANKLTESNVNLSSDDIRRIFLGILHLDCNNNNTYKLIRALSVKIAASDAICNESCLSIMCTSLHNMHGEEESVQLLISSIANRLVNHNHIDFNARQISLACFGLKNTFDCRATHSLVRALAEKINASTDSNWDPLSIALSVYGLQNLSSTDISTHLIARALAMKISTSSDSFMNSKEISMVCYGLKNLNHESGTLLVRSLEPMITNSNAILSSNSIPRVIIGIRSLNINDVSVQRLITTLCVKITASPAAMDAPIITTTCQNLKSLDINHSSIKSLITVLALKIATSPRKMWISKEFIFIINDGIQHLNSQDFCSKLLIGALKTHIAKDNVHILNQLD